MCNSIQYQVDHLCTFLKNIMDQQQHRQTEKMKFLLFSASMRNDSLNTRLIKLAASLVEKNNGAEAAKHYPCVKKTWVEFLGEKPDPATERVE